MIEFDGVQFNELISLQIMETLRRHDSSLQDIAPSQISNRVTRSVFMAAVAEMNGLPFFPRIADFVDETLLEKCDMRVLSRNHFTPVCRRGHRIIVAISNPWSGQARDYLSARFPNFELQNVVTPANEISRTLELISDTQGPTKGELEALDVEEIDDGITDFEVNDNHTEPIAQLLATILARSVKLKASDIHFKVEKSTFYYQFRVNGDLGFRTEIPVKLKDRVDAFMLNLVRIPPEKRSTSPGLSGRFSISYLNRTIDIRFERHRTYRGYHSTLRLLDKSGITVALGKGGLAFDPETMFHLRKVMKVPAGIIVMSGPTGSGKSTTLNAMLRELNTPTENILTLENPVEDEIPGVVHCDLKSAAEFKPMIASFMRSDPDIILMGEVRDFDSAELAIEAAVTGHKVLTTVHTQRASQIIERFEQLGIERWKIAQTLKAACAQRLLKILCPKCKRRESGVSEDDRRLFNLDESWAHTPIYRANPEGCDECGNSGYAGRTALLEILPITPKMGDRLARGEISPYDLEVELLQKGTLPSLRRSGLRHLKEGKTDLSALSKVIDMTYDD